MHVSGERAAASWLRAWAALAALLAVPAAAATVAAVATADPEQQAIVRSACRGTRCVKACGRLGREYSSVTDVQRGAFTAAGADEALVSLFPCGEPMSFRQEGRLALRRHEAKGWRRVADSGDAFFSGECRRQHASGRDVLFCQAGVGPNQGIMTDALCVVSWDGHAVKDECPIRVTDVSAAGCFSKGAATGRSTWYARIAAWRETRSGDQPGASLDIELAIEKVAPQTGDDSLDPACRRAMKRLEKPRLQKLTLDAVFDGHELKLTPESGAARKPFEEIFD